MYSLVKEGGLVLLDFTKFLTLENLTLETLANSAAILAQGALFQGQWFGFRVAAPLALPLRQWPLLGVSWLANHMPKPASRWTENFNRVMISFYVSHLGVFLVFRRINCHLCFYACVRWNATLATDPPHSRELRRQ